MTEKPEKMRGQRNKQKRKNKPGRGFTPTPWDDGDDDAGVCE